MWAGGSLRQRPPKPHEYSASTGSIDEPYKKWKFSLADVHERKCNRIGRVVDELNQRFGKSAVYFANIQSVLDAAPTRISFTSVPELGEF